MKDDSDDGSWRSGPVGRDVKKNEYWHLGRDRLWIKRPTEKPTPEPRDLKRKRGNTKATQKPSKRKALENGAAKATSKKATKPKKAEPKPKASKPVKKVSETVHKRNTSRLMRTGDDGWQKVPEEWLKKSSRASSPQTQQNEKSDVEALFDDASDLTDLSEEEKKQSAKDESSSESDLTDLDEEEEEKVDSKVDVSMESQSKDEGPFIEFETICIGISEFKEFAEKSRNSKSHNERRLYRYIMQVIVPEMEEWQEALEEKQKQELKDMLKREQAAAAAAAAAERPKRSTRLAAIADDDKKQSSQGSESEGWGRATRTRRAAARTARWFSEHQDSLADTPIDSDEEGAPRSGEQKDDGTAPTISRKKKLGSDQEDYQEDVSDAEVEEAPPSSPPLDGRGRPRRAAAIKADLNRPKPTTRRRRARSDSEDAAESDEPFFLNCEVCKRSGWNQDDSQHLISCQDCGIWQHMICHDRADKHEGRPKRNWGQEKFLCTACTEKAKLKRPRRGRKPKDPQAEDATMNEGTQEDSTQPVPDSTQASTSRMETVTTSDSVLEPTPLEEVQPPTSDPPKEYPNGIPLTLPPQPQPQAQTQVQAQPQLQPQWNSDPPYGFPHTNQVRTLYQQRPPGVAQQGFQPSPDLPFGYQPPVTPNTPQYSLHGSSHFVPPPAPLLPPQQQHFAPYMNGNMQQAPYQPNGSMMAPNQVPLQYGFGHPNGFQAQPQQQPLDYPLAYPLGNPPPPQ